jgi:hypothetical protein
MELIRTINGSDEAKNCSSFNKIRMIQVPTQGNRQPLYDFEQPALWTAPSEGFLQNFSAICWYFGKEVFRKINIPVGLVQNCVPYVLFKFLVFDCCKYAISIISIIQQKGFKYRKMDSK